MSDPLDPLFANNRRWAERMETQQPGFFTQLLAQQMPQYLWIGCSDSRVPANELVGLLPGELFVHRNVANLVVHTDLNALSVIQYAVDVLGVLHVIVVGHSQCGGVRAALEGRRAGLVDNWLRDMHAGLLACIPYDPKRLDALVELNVLEQARNVCFTTVVKDAWARGQPVTVHGWVYGLHNGLLEDLRIRAASLDDVLPAYARGLAAVTRRYLSEGA
jgi:carbonic anhydrase